jgi:hypothetical protein
LSLSQKSFIHNGDKTSTCDSNTIIFAGIIFKMNDLLAKVKVTVNDCIYIRDPVSSSLGIRIVAGSIEMIDGDGFDSLTFRKLPQIIGSTEASIYRYFESKHKLLLYLIGWYWAWLVYKMVFALLNISSPYERLEKAIALLTEAPHPDVNYEHVNTEKLCRIFISESAKTYLTKEVHEENKIGIFSDYKNLVGKTDDIILEINPSYKFPHMLVTTTIEGAHQQRFFADHLPRLTDVLDNEDAISAFITN